MIIKYPQSLEKLVLLAASFSTRLVDEGLVNVGNDTTTGNGGLDQGIEFFVTTNGELQVSRGDTLDLQVLAGVASEFEHFGRQVLQNGRRVNSGGGSDAVALVDGLFQETMDTADCIKKGEKERLLATLEQETGDRDSTTTQTNR